MEVYRNLRLITLAVVAMVIIDAINQPVILLLGMFAPEFFAANITPIATEVDGASAAILLLTMLIFGYWIYAAGRNVTDAGVAELKFTPAARIWWFAVPFANFVMPFQGMRELWNASHGEPRLETNHWLVSSWWALWLINNVTANLGGILTRGEQSGTMLSWAIAATGAPLAVVAIVLVRSIAAAQQRAGPQELIKVFA